MRRLGFTKEIGDPQEASIRKMKPDVKVRIRPGAIEAYKLGFTHHLSGDLAQEGTAQKRPPVHSQRPFLMLLCCVVRVTM